MSPVGSIYENLILNFVLEIFHAKKMSIFKPASINLKQNFRIPQPDPPWRHPLITDCLNFRLIGENLRVKKELWVNVLFQRLEIAPLCSCILLHSSDQSANNFASSLQAANVQNINEHILYDFLINS